MIFRGSLQDIRLFVAAYQEQSFTAAAVREFSTQSGVSHHVRRLETLLKVRLFNREQARVTPTPAADLLYEHCVKLLRDLDSAADEVERYSPGYQGLLRLGVMPALSHHIIAPVLLQFADQHPNVRVEVMESFSASLGSMVASGQLDMAIGAYSVDTPGIKATPLFRSPECLIAGHHDSVGRPGLAELAKTGPHNIVWATRQTTRRRVLESALDSNGIAIGSTLLVDSSLATLDLVRRSNWKTIAPALVMDPTLDAEVFHVVPLLDPAVTLEVSLIERSASTLLPEGKVLVAMISKEAETNYSRHQSAWETSAPGKFPTK